MSLHKEINFEDEICQHLAANSDHIMKKAGSSSFDSQYGMI